MMNGLSTVPQIPAGKPFYKNKFFIVLLIVIFQAIYTIALLNISKINSQSQNTESVSTPSKNMLSEDESPIGFALLKNPIVNQWRGGIEGVLTAKDEKSITLSNKIKNAELTIPLNAPRSEGDKPMTVFHSLKQANAGKNSQVELKDIPVGTYLRGDFFVIPWPDDKNKIVGSSFTIVEE